MWRRTFLLFLLGLLLVGIILYLVNPFKVWDEMQNVPFKFLLVLLFLQITIMINSAVKWRTILMNSRVSMKNILTATFVGHLVNNITPVGLAGGEPVRAYLLSKTEKIRFSTAVSSVIVDLFLEIFPIFILIVISMAMILVGGESETLAIILGIIAVALLALFVITIILITHKNLIPILTQRLLDILIKIPILREYAKRKREDIDGISKRFKKAMKEHMMDAKILFFGTTISIIGWILRFLRVYLAFIALGYNIPLSTLIIVETAVLAISFVPIFPGALGIWEGSSIGLFVVFGVDGAVASAATIIDRAFFYILPSIIGVISSIYCGINLSNIMQSKN